MISFLTSVAQANELQEKKAFARIIVENYMSLLTRRANFPMQAIKDNDLSAEHDKNQIKEIREQIIPQIKTGDFDIILFPAGLIAVETNDRRIALKAPNDDWDEELKGIVKLCSAGNHYAQKLIHESETITGHAWTPPSLPFILVFGDIDSVEPDFFRKASTLLPEGYRVADWNDLKNYTRKGGRVKDVWELLGSQSFMVTNGGKPTYANNISYNGSRFHRWYWTSWSERPGQSPSSNFLSHDNIGQLHLGSWGPRTRILAIKK